MLTRRKSLRLAASVLAMPFVARASWAQGYPSRPVRVVVGYAPGGSADIAARIIAQWLSEKLGQQFIVENRPGAGTNIATETVVRAAPDGYTLSLVDAAGTINASLYPRLNFNFLRDIVPVASLARQPQVLLLNPTVPAKSFPEFVPLVKDSPGKITMASAGNGSPGHLAGELLKMMTGLSFLHVPYRGAGPALTDLLAGHVQMSFVGMAGSLEYIKSGVLRGLAVTTSGRSESIPEVPTVSEFVPGYEVASLFGLGAPRGTPASIINTLNREVSKALADPKVQTRFRDVGGTPFIQSPTEFGKFLADETEKWGKVIRAANIKPE